jgi:hypothetical protein
MSCFLAPFMLAFSDNIDTTRLNILDTIMNIFFLIDMILLFFTAYINDDLDIVDTKKEIALEYLKSWFPIDLISVIPFDLIITYGQFTRIARISRISKISKIIRMTKMVRLLKIGKVRTKLFKNFSQMTEINAGLERLIFLMIFFVVMVHVIACLWIFIATFDETSKVNWIYSKGI